MLGASGSWRFDFDFAHRRQRQPGPVDMRGASSSCSFSWFIGLCYLFVDEAGPPFRGTYSGGGAWCLVSYVQCPSSYVRVTVRLGSTHWACILVDGLDGGCDAARNICIKFWAIGCCPRGICRNSDFPSSFPLLVAASCRTAEAQMYHTKECRRGRRRGKRYNVVC